MRYRSQMSPAFGSFRPASRPDSIDLCHHRGTKGVPNVDVLDLVNKSNLARRAVFSSAHAQEELPMRPAAVAGAIQGKLGATPEGVEDVGLVCEQADISDAKSVLKAVKGRGFVGRPRALTT